MKEDFYDEPKKIEKPENKVSEPTIKISSEEQTFKVGKFFGTAITGFIDVEKFITFGKHTFFLEKKLPFQILIISDFCE
jgi:hypothetical protein